MTTTTVINGVDVDRLVATIGAIQEDAGVAEMTFRATTKWEGGGTSRAVIDSFTHAGQKVERPTSHTFVGSEPDVLLGEDAGPNAVEAVLAALGFCYSVGFVYNAAAKGIKIEELTYSIEGDLDLRTFVGLEGPRAGFKAIRVKGSVKAEGATAADLQKLNTYVQQTSPVLDIISNPLPVTTELEVL